jgi:putative transposase
MSRFRLLPTDGQEEALLGHCRDARHVWNLAVEQQALRDFAQAMRNFFSGTHRRPTWRKAGVHEGFRQVVLKPRHVERVNRRFGRVWVPKVGWVRFRASRPVPAGVKSYGSPVIGLAAGMWRSPTFLTPSPVQAIAAWLVSTAALRWRQRCRPVNCCAPLA